MCVNVTRFSRAEFHVHNILYFSFEFTCFNTSVYQFCSVDPEILLHTTFVIMIITVMLSAEL